jgi:hypothetical protein
MPLSLNVNFRDIERAAIGARAAVGALVPSAVLIAAGTKILVANIKAETPVRTGKGKASITAVGPGIWGVKYLTYVNEGTKPHTIVPVKAQALRFVVNGRVVFAKSVHHPGNKPNAFVKRGVEKSKPALRVLMFENGRMITSMIQKGG